jgi:hypothetical protein
MNSHLRLKFHNVPRPLLNILSEFQIEALQTRRDVFTANGQVNLIQITRRYIIKEKAKILCNSHLKKNLHLYIYIGYLECHGLNQNNIWFG